MGVGIMDKWVDPIGTLINVMFWKMNYGKECALQ